MRKIASLSIDLDEIDCYAQIHGLNATHDEVHPVYERAIERFVKLFEGYGISATFFAIGRDLNREKNRDILQAAHAMGHEIANHSENHFYDFSRKSESEIETEITRCGDRIAEICGKRPVGFRSPGYTTNDRVLAILTRLGYQYDSSVFPSLPYYGAKNAAISWIKARGRRSHSVRDTPMMLGAPRQPYRIGTPYWKRGSGLIELPMAVTPRRFGTIPLIGTNVVLAPFAITRGILRTMRHDHFINLEMHGIDLLDAERDNLGWLQPHQPDLRARLDEKVARLRHTIEWLSRRDYEFMTLENAASTLFPTHIVGV